MLDQLVYVHVPMDAIDYQVRLCYMYHYIAGKLLLARFRFGEFFMICQFAKISNAYHPRGCETV